MTIHDTVESDGLVTVSGTLSPLSTISSKGDHSDTKATMIEDRSKSASCRNRQPTMIRREGAVRVSSEKPHKASENGPVRGFRAMSAQERTSLSLKLRVEEEAEKFSEQKSKIVK
ncbi:hypothetical protein DPMN_183055, partial [Dreissena polymorpha]